MSQGTNFQSLCVFKTSVHLNNVSNYVMSKDLILSEKSQLLVKVFDEPPLMFKYVWIFQILLVQVNYVKGEIDFTLKSKIN